MILVLAVLFGVMGSYLLYISWKGHSHVLAVCGWSCMLATLPLWVMNSGAEYGTVFALSVPAIFVWLGIFSEQKTQSIPKHIEKSEMPIRWQGKSVAIHSWYVVYHLIVLMLVSSLMVIAFANVLPLDRPTQLAVGIILLPLVWAILSFWHLVSEQKRMPLLFSVLGTLLAGLYLFF